MRYVGVRQIVIDDRPTPTPFWTPTRDFHGRAVVVIGGGPSLADLDPSVLRGHRFIAVNSGAQVLRPASTADDVLYFTDNSWNENRPAIAASWPGPVVAANRNVKMRLGEAVRYLDIFSLTERIGTLPDYVQASSGHIAACLAAVMGARRVVLYAFEACAVAGRTHGHDHYSTHDHSVFDERFLPGWNGLSRAFARMGVEVVNATPGGALHSFPRMSLQEALADDAP